MGTISGCRHLKVNLKAKFIYMFPLLPKGDQTKLLKFFWLKIFSICHWCRWHRWQTLSCEYLREFLKKIETVLMGLGGNWFLKRTRSKKSRDTVPLNVIRGGAKDTFASGFFSEQFHTNVWWWGFANFNRLRKLLKFLTSFFVANDKAIYYS